MIRLATRDDVVALVALEVACFGTGAWGAGLIEAAIDDPAQDVLVAHTGDAWAVVRVVGDTADLDRIATDPTRRRRGVARGLLDEVLTRAAAAGASRVLLEVGVDNAAALALYGSAGFEEVHRRARYYPGGVDAVVMQRRLADAQPHDRVDA